METKEPSENLENSLKQNWAAISSYGVLNQMLDCREKLQRLSSGLPQTTSILPERFSL
jgi:hypothetical protein